VPFPPDFRPATRAPVVVVLAALLLAPAFCPGGARAQDGGGRDNQAREHFLVGKRYFEQARYPEAAREFEEAYRLSGRSELLLNLALAEERALDYQASIAALNRYLEVEPATPDRAEIEARIERLEVLQAEEAARVRAQAEALAARQGDEPASAGNRQRGDGDGGPSTLQWVGMGLLVGAGAFGGAALGTGLAAESIYDDLDSAQDADGRIPADRVDDRDRGESLARASTALSFTALGLAIGGLVLVIVGADHGADDDGESGSDADVAAASGARARPPRVSLVLGPDGGQATLGFTF